MPVTILKPGGAEGEVVEARVESDVAYTILPSALLRRLGWEERFSRAFRLPNGQCVELEMAEVRVKLGEDQRFTVCIAGEDADEAVIGETTLSTFGLRFDSDHGHPNLVRETASL